MLSLVYYRPFESLSTLKTLSGSNYKKWTRDIELAGLMDLDVYLLEYKPVVSSDDISSGSKTKEKSNFLSMMVLKRSISETICGGIPSCEIVKEFLDTRRQKFKCLINQNQNLLKSI